MESIYYLAPLFFIAALIYSSVGFGGGSTYLALLFLFNVPYSTIPQIALLCNLLVVSGNLYHYLKIEGISLRLVLPFTIMSIPMAYLGGRIAISKNLFLILLGISLLAAGSRLLFAKKLAANVDSTNIDQVRIWGRALPIGGVLGFLSGVVGIGGGIFLAPAMYLLKLGRPIQIAAASSFYIFVNSLAGLIGQLTKTPAEMQVTLLFPL